MISSYKILFSVELLNDYYSERICNDFSIIPSAATVSLLRDQQLLFKNIGNRLVLLTKISRDPDPAKNGKPLATLDADSRYTFYLSLNTPEFTSFSNINLELLQSKRLYFTNLNQNKHLTFAHLSEKIDTYDINNHTKKYLPGDFADDGTNKIFECIKESVDNQTDNVTFWVPRDDIQFVSGKDFIQPLNSIFNYQAPVAVNDFSINVFGLSTQTNTYDQLVSSQKLVFEEATKNIQVDLSKMRVRTGKYRITINGDELVVYVDNEMVYGGYLGVIEIFAHLPNGNDFAFLDAAGKPVELAYFIRFANRLATWKYISSRHGVTAIKHPTNKYTFNPKPAPPATVEYFESNVPVPLTQFPEEFRLELLPKISSGPPRAPGPDVRMPGVLNKTLPGNDFVCNIYLNY